MGLTKWLLSLLPSNKTCGCDQSMGTEHSYQFRVRAKETGDRNLLQVREKSVCEHCEDEHIDVLVELDCDYEPREDIHERKVGVDEDDMTGYGFMSQDELAKMLIEMRLADCLRPVESLDR